MQMIYSVLFEAIEMFEEMSEDMECRFVIKASVTVIITILISY